jgi:para-aminobenzoate synthetase component 1
VFKPSYDDVLSKLENHHRYIPITYPLELDHSNWFLLYKELVKKSSYHALLESGRAGRYSFIAYRPTHVLRGKNKELSIRTLYMTKDKENQDRSPSYISSKVNEAQIEEKRGDLLVLLREWMQNRQAPRISDLPDFQGGLLGLYSYDLVREIENLSANSKDDLETPDVYLMAFDQVIAYDHQEDKHWLLRYHEVDHKDFEKCYKHAQELVYKWHQELEEMISQGIGQVSEISNFTKSRHEKTQEEASIQGDSGIEAEAEQVIPSFSEDEFVQAVQRIQKYISEGDVFQVNLSVRQSKPLTSEPLAIYEELRRINPSPYMGYLQFPDLQLISASPEQLIKVRENVVNTRPIAGTRSRGHDREEDIRLAKELIDNEKERAEHVMLVDLERNDLGKVCQFGTVQVDEFMVIEEYSHVMHIVSNVVGQLAGEYDVIDVINAVFPGGTITGAPKVRTMEIIEELEPVRRGIYTGSIGWLDYNGDMELNIVIRTMLAKNGIAHVQAGAGIVIDSIPVNEYKESLKKAEALWKAFEQSKEKEIIEGKEKENKKNKELSRSRGGL